MKITNFRNLKLVDGLPFHQKLFAEVDVVTGALWWKKTVTRKISRSIPGFWFFVDTGDFTPFTDVETMERAYKATHPEAIS